MISWFVFVQLAFAIFEIKQQISTFLFFLQNSEFSKGITKSSSKDSQEKSEKFFPVCTKVPETPQEVKKLFHTAIFPSVNPFNELVLNADHYMVGFRAKHLNDFLVHICRGIYLANILYHEDKIMVTTEDHIPIVEVDENFPSNYQQDFLWFMKVR